MSETPARSASSAFVQPFTAQSSAISWPLNLAVGVTTVSIANRQYAHPVSTVNNNRQQQSTMPTGSGVASLPMPHRPVFHPGLGQFFEELRLAKGWGQSEAAELARRRGITAVTRQVLLRLELGKTKWPAPRVLEGLASLYDRTYEDLVREVTKHAYFRVQESAAQSGPVTPVRAQSASTPPLGDVDHVAHARLLEEHANLTEENAALRVAVDDLAEQFKRLAGVIKTRPAQGGKPGTRRSR